MRKWVQVIGMKGRAKKPSQCVSKQAVGPTALEVPLKPTGLIAKGQRSLDILVATTRAGISVGPAQ
jgi:hypothetical protein